MATRRPAGLSGLDSLIPPAVDEETAAAEQPAAEPAAPARTRGTATRTAAAGRVGKDKLSGYVPIETLEAVRDVVYRVPGIGMGEFLEEAAKREIRRLEKLHNNGEPFAPRPTGEQLRPGPKVR